jgi:hypothetical protein
MTDIGINRGTSFVPTLNEYEQLWLNDQGLESDSLLSREEENFFLSADFNEATYNIPFEVIDENRSFCDKVMNNFKPWNVFHELFEDHQRVVDMDNLIDQGYWDGSQFVTSTRGTFMGDGMSFIDLTLLLGGIVRAVWNAQGLERPLGQSVGDDLFLMLVKLLEAVDFCHLAEQLGCKFSKLNSVSEDSLTFCEQYAAVCSNREDYEDLKSFANSQFADLTFLDSIKGSTLSGQGKVDIQGTNPFIGHAGMLNKQIRWSPIGFVKERSPILLWASNFMEASGLGASMASLPIPLGGLDLAVGSILNYHDESFYKDKLPYYEAMLLLKEDLFLKYYLLLRGIFQINPKGFSWSNDFEVITEIVSNLELIRPEALDKEIPDNLRNSPYRVKNSFIMNRLELISFHHLSAELARRESFHKQWVGKQVREPVTLKLKQVRARQNKAWAVIKSNLQPVQPNDFRSHSMRNLADKFQEKTWGLFVNKNDPAIQEAFQGMPTLFLEW